MNGKLVILATGRHADVFSSGGEVVDLIEKVQAFNGTSIFIETYSVFESNRLFCYTVFESLKNGHDIILIAPDEDMIDKRLRDRAIVFRLPRETP